MKQSALLNKSPHVNASPTAAQDKDVIVNLQLAAPLAV
jgi:hypothetical protein